MRAALFGNKQTGDLPLHPRRDQNRARLGQRLHPRSDVGTSPKISPAGSTTTGPVSMPMRALSDGLPEPAFLRFSSASARWIDSAARTARSESFSCATG